MSRLLNNKDYNKMLSCIRDHSKNDTTAMFYEHKTLVNNYLEELFKLLKKEGFIIKPHYKDIFYKDISSVISRP